MAFDVDPRPVLYSGRSQYRIDGGRDGYGRVVLVIDDATAEILICGPGDVVCTARRVTNPAVLAYLRWHVGTIRDCARRERA